MSPKGNRSRPKRILVESPKAMAYFSRPCHRLWGRVVVVVVVVVAIPASVAPLLMARGRTPAAVDCSIKKHNGSNVRNFCRALATQARGDSGFCSCIYFLHTWVLILSQKYRLYKGSFSQFQVGEKVKMNLALFVLKYHLKRDETK